MLESELLRAAYRQGIFPMALEKSGEIGWFSPDPRAIIPLDDKFHVPHGLRRTLKKNRFTVTFDQEFEQVMRECAQRPAGTWISEAIIASYCELHRLGHAHSVEVWLVPPSSLVAPRCSSLAGGLYGVHLGGAFFGESMFHRTTDASKIALVALVERLRDRRFRLLDTQWLTPHLAQFGTYEITRAHYRRRLRAALALDCRF
jgi:leucyl/phenylalanyl-tRNA---protein transferase